MEQKTTLIIFYSWQSDLSRETNQQAIASCLKTCFIGIEENNESIKLKLDEATRDEAGSPDIPTTIFKKISDSDIFVCDITTINHNETTIRKTPNPNVLIELGYAISILGWERIIMVFNNHFGDFKTELPFDLEKRRLTPFKIVGKTDKNGKLDLTSKFTTAIETIIKKNPAKPSDSKKKSTDEIKREKDLTNLKLIMSYINIPTFDNFLSKLPTDIIKDIFDYWNLFRIKYDSNAFYIYDKSLNEKLKNLRVSWGNIFNYMSLYRTASNGYNFRLIHLDEQTQNEFTSLNNECYNLNVLFKDLMVFIQENYLEIDLNELSSQAKSKLFIRKIDEGENYFK